MRYLYLLSISLLSGLLSCQTGPTQTFDVLITNGTVYDGTGGEGIQTDVWINEDTIARIGKVKRATATTVIDAKGMAVSPGFINMLSWATESLIEDGKSQSDIRQGVTLEIMGEGNSMGPVTEERKLAWMKAQGDIKYDIKWNTLGEYLEYLENRGVSTNVASLIGAATPRVNVIGFEDRAPTAEELKEMQEQVRVAMEEGAMGVGSALIYTPGFFAQTDELIALCQVAAEYDGLFTSHLRSESKNIIGALDEFLTIATEAGIRSEVYHLKAAGKENWSKLDEVIAKIDSAREAGLSITTDMYNYTAGATGLDAAMPPWVQEGGLGEWISRLQDPAIRKRVASEMKQEGEDWENLYYASGSAEKLLLVGFKNPDLRKYTGKSLAAVAVERGTSPEETAMDLVIEDKSRVGTVYFLMSEENVKKKMQLPWMSFCSDAGSLAPEGNFLKSNPHPRAYGNFARLLGKYVRDEQVIPMEEAIYKLSGLPASNLKLKKRGLLQEGYFADVVIFDPATIQDHATFDEPHQYATGVIHVFVNGRQVLKDGEHTGLKSGRVVRGPGWTGWSEEN
ncbi:MAG: D-aminoacylase [Bacteroidota bacterium]